ncbi:MAG: NAD(P)H-hydrate epimerase, partial [Candidatus Dadabacteria bacterium]|nr:NAD(P)H-hydrate epimerase [Candidatus Dadabacteria bacterium]NIQ16691.1 NAD(P)H-hydrate epimerase [Candidatus Dadabacteria bacterium]
MKLATREIIKLIDKKTIEKFKIPGLTLMENAGRASSDVICNNYPDAKEIGIICGGGNNGGDGFVIARQLISRGKNVRTYIINNRNEYNGDAKTNLEALLKISDKVVELKDSISRIKDADIFVDAIFGTGLDREVRGFYKKIISRLNNSDKPCVSIDIPSGLDCNTGRPLGISVIADTTITFVIP